MGLIEVPVPATDPAYPIYKSQAEFAVGNEDSVGTSATGADSF